MEIQIDTREKQRAVVKILEEFDRQGVKHVSSKLYVGDYMTFDNPRLIIDRKQNLFEVCNNVCQQHDRFITEMKKANDIGIKLIFLVEHGGGIIRDLKLHRWRYRVRGCTRYSQPFPRTIMSSFFFATSGTPASGSLSCCSHEI